MRLSSLRSPLRCEDKRRKPDPVDPSGVLGRPRSYGREGDEGDGDGTILVVSLPPLSEDMKGGEAIVELTCESEGEVEVASPELRIPME